MCSPSEGSLRTSQQPTRLEQRPSNQHAFGNWQRGAIDVTRQDFPANPVFVAASFGPASKAYRVFHPCVLMCRRLAWSGCPETTGERHGLEQPRTKDARRRGGTTESRAERRHRRPCLNVGLQKQCLARSGSRPCAHCLLIQVPFIASGDSGSAACCVAARILFFNLAGKPQKSTKSSAKRTVWQKFPADPKTNWSGHSCSFQLAKTLPQTNLHW